MLWRCCISASVKLVNGRGKLNSRRLNSKITPFYFAMNSVSSCVMLIATVATNTNYVIQRFLLFDDPASIRKRRAWRKIITERLTVKPKFRVQKFEENKYWQRFHQLNLRRYYRKTMIKIVTFWGLRGKFSVLTMQILFYNELPKKKSATINRWFTFPTDKV